MPLTSINSFLKTCGVQEMSVLTAVAKITGDLSVKEQISFYIANAKKASHFEVFWTCYGIQLPDMVTVLKYYSCMQCSSVPCKLSFSLSGYINRKQRCSLSLSTIQFSMYRKNQYDNSRDYKT